jgi:Flp pilus assembly protein TadG
VSRRAEGDRGTVLMLVIGFAIILIVMVGVVVDVSAVVLAKRSVAASADGAAVSAAQSLDLEALYRDGLRDQLPLDPAEAASRVAAYEAQAALGQPGLRLSVQVDGRTAVVTATRTVPLPFPVPGSAGTVDVVSVARARAPVP